MHGDVQEHGNIESMQGLFPVNPLCSSPVTVIGVKLFQEERERKPAYFFSGKSMLTHRSQIVRSITNLPTVYIAAVVL